MSDFVIMTDSAADLPEEYIREHQISVLPLFYNLEGVVYGGRQQQDIRDFYQMMRSGKMPTTMAVNPEDAAKVMEKQLQAGMDILYLAFSSGLSSSYQSAVIAADEMQGKYPQQKIIVVDTLAASLGQGLLVHKAAEQKRNGRTMDEIAAWLEENKLHLCHLFTVDDLYHLHRGGRVSKTAAVLGTIVNVKPVLHVDNEGKLIPLQNVRGRKKSLNMLVELMAKELEGYEEQNDTVFISHGDCLADAEYVAGQVRQKLGIQNVMIGYVSAVIGAHSGPGTMALFFMGKNR